MLALAVWGCEPRNAEPLWTVSDSAGVEIVTSEGVAPGWTLSSDPVVSLGVVDQAGPTQFFRVEDVEILEDLGLAVANRGSEQVRLFDSDGRYRTSFGREGYGPREFRGLQMLASYHDSLLVYDARNDRISVWTMDGEFGRSFRLEWFAGLLAPVDLLGSEGVLAVTARYMSELVGSGLVVDTALVSHYDLRGHLIDSIARLPHNERVVQRQGDFQTTLSAPFSAHGPIVGTSSGFCYAFGPVADILCFDSTGSLEQIVRVRMAPREVTESDVSDFWREQLDQDEGPRLEAFRRMRDFMPFPAMFPAYSQLLVDAAGRLWARRYSLPGETEERWFVFESGQLVGELRSPLGFRVMDVKENRIAGVFTDDLGIEFVQVYEFERT